MDRSSYRRGGSAGQRSRLVPDDVTHPVDLRPSRPPLTIVCGAPGAGKSSLVSARAGPGAVIIDLDAIIDEISGHRGARTPELTLWLERGLLERNRRLRSLASSGAPEAWFIVGAPKAEERAKWAQMLGATAVVVIETPIAETIRRINGDPERLWIADRQRRAAYS
ncbi:MAG: AAA family ATPase, partial [Ignavibacteriales bacterium]